jgi:hypothetical protein
MSLVSWVGTGTQRYPPRLRRGYGSRVRNLPNPLSGLSPWGRLVAVSAVLVIGSLLTIGIWALLTTEREISTYSVRGSLNGINLDIGDGDAQIIGAGTSPVVAVQRTDHFSFGHDADTRRSLERGVLRIRARCPTTVLHTCSSNYQLRVPENVPIVVRTGSGAVNFDGFRGTAHITTGSGGISVSGFCGFVLQARSETGDVDASAACPTERMALRSRTGHVHATVPPGRYRIDADSDTGGREVKRLTPADEAPFQIQALSSEGDVVVEGRQ